MRTHVNRYNVSRGNGRDVFTWLQTLGVCLWCLQTNVFTSDNMAYGLNGDSEFKPRSAVFKIIDTIFEESYFLGYDAVHSVEIQPTLMRNESRPSSASNNKSRKTPA
jgi:hypothetical protein